MSTTLTGGRLRTMLRSVAALVVSAVAAAGLTAAGLLLVGVAPASAATGTFSDPSISIDHVGTVATVIDPDLSDSTMASNDRLGVTWAFSAQGVTAGTLSQTLPAGWTWDVATLGSLSSTSSAYHSEYTLSPDGRTLAATVSVPGQAYLELGTLVAVPGGDVVSGSDYVPELVLTDQSGAATVTAAPVTVVSEPRADLYSATLANAVAGNFDLNGDSTAEAAYSVDMRLTVQDAPGAASIGAANVELAQPLTISDSFLVSDPGVNVVAELVDQSESGASVSLGQSGTDLTLTIDGATSLPDFWITVRYWFAATDVPTALDSPSTVDISNTATAVGWTSTLGDPVSEDQGNNTSTGFVQVPAPPAASVESGVSIFAAADPAAPLYGIDPASDSQWSLVDESSIAPGSIVQDRFFLTTHTATATDLIGYDFWDPDTRRIGDAADLFVADASGAPLNPSTYSVQYTSGSDAVDPASNSWHGSIAAAGGIAAVSGVRVMYTAGVFASDTIVAAVPFAVVAEVGESVTGTAAWTYNENPAVVSSTASATVHGQLLSVSRTADASSIVSGAPVTYTVSPAVAVPAGTLQPAIAPGLTITDTLPPGAAAVDLDGLDPLWGAEQTGNIDDGFVLTFTYLGVADSSAALPSIVYTVVTAVEAPGPSYSSTSVVSAAGTTQSLAVRTASATITVVQAKIVALQNVVDGPANIEVDETQISWLGSWHNFTSSSKGTAYFVTVLPAHGDGRGTNFHGSARLSSVQLAGSAATLQYTTDPTAVVNDASPQDSATVTWISTGSTDLSTLSGITALRVVVADFTSGSGGAGSIRVTLDVDAQKAGDRYVGTVRGWAQGTQSLSETAPARVDVVASSLSGSVWNDADRSATRDPGERGIKGASIDLLNANGDVVASKTTATGGGYHFTELPSGSYRVRVDESTLGRAQVIVNTFDRDGDRDGDSGALTLPPDSAIGDVDYGYALETTRLSLIMTTNGIDSAKGPGPVIAVGHPVDWQYTVTNTGTTTVTGVDVVDSAIGAAEAPRRFTGTLAPGESVVFSAQGTAVDGQYSHSATATGKSSSRSVTARDRSWYLGAVPSLSISKQISVSADGPWTDQVDLTPGATAYWKLTVTNTGRTAVSGVAIEDSLLEVHRPVGDLDPGKSVSIVISQTMIDAFLSTDFAGNAATGIGAGDTPGTGVDTSTSVAMAEFAAAVGAAKTTAGTSDAELAATGGAQRGALLLGGMLLLMSVVAFLVGRRRRSGHRALRH